MAFTLTAFVESFPSTLAIPPPGERESWWGIVLSPSCASSSSTRAARAVRSRRLVRFLAEDRSPSRSHDVFFACQRAPLHGLACRGVRVPRRCRHLRFGERQPAVLASRLRGSTTLAALLPDPARVLHRTPVVGFVMFRRCDARPHHVVPALRSLDPPAQRALLIAQPRRVRVTRASRPGTPRTLPPRRLRRGSPTFRPGTSKQGRTAGS